MPWGHGLMGASGTTTDKTRLGAAMCTTISSAPRRMGHISLFRYAASSIYRAILEQAERGLISRPPTEKQMRLFPKEDAGIPRLFEIKRLAASSKSRNFALMPQALSPSEKANDERKGEQRRFKRARKDKPIEEKTLAVLRACHERKERN